MKLIKIHPQILTKEIKYIYLLENGSENEIPDSQGHLPDGTFELMINYGAPVYHTNGQGKFLVRPDIVFIGGYKKFHYIKYTGKIHLIGVVFDQAHVSRFVQDRMNHSSEMLLPATSVFGPEIQYVAEQLYQVSSIDQIRLVIENYFLQVIPLKSAYQSNRIAAAVNLMLSNQNKIRVNDIADKVCMSPRNFRRAFGETTGYSPSEMLRIIRAKRLIHFLKKNQSIRKAARHLGYHDAAHIMHDFRSFGGSTPSEYINQMTSIDLNFFELSEYAG